MTLSLEEAQRRAVRLLADRKKRQRAPGVEILLVVVAALLITGIAAVATRPPNTIVLIRDLRAGEVIAMNDLALARLPALAGVFHSKEEVNDVVALHDLQSGTVLRLADVARPQAVAAAAIRNDDPLTPANVVFRRIAGLDDAMTNPDSVYGRRAKNFLPAGTVVRKGDVGDARYVTEVRRGEAAVPLQAVTGALRLYPNQTITVVATPASGEKVVVDGARLLAAREDGAIVVAVPRADAARLASLRGAEIHVMVGDP